MKRTFKIIKTAVAMLLISCILTGCSSPVISERVMNSLLGAYQYAGNLIEQIKTEGLGSVAAIFKSSSDEEESEAAEEGESKPEESKSEEDKNEESSKTEDEKDKEAKDKE